MFKCERKEYREKQLNVPGKYNKNIFKKKNT